MAFPEIIKTHPTSIKERSAPGKTTIGNYSDIFAEK